MAREDAKYRQIADKLRAGIKSGKFPPGTLLPSEAQLQKQYGVAQATVRNAVRVLREAGLAESERGVGVWVRKPADPGPSQYDIMMARMDAFDERLTRLEAERARLREQEP